MTRIDGIRERRIKVPQGARWEDTDYLLEGMEAARPVMEWAADDKCFKSGSRKTIKRCDCPPCQARAWKKEYYPEENHESE